MLGVDVVASRAIAEVLPGDDRATRLVRDNRDPVLYGCGSTQRAAIGGPRRIHRSGGQHVLRVDVVLGAVAAILPGNDRVACPVANDRGGDLVMRGRAQRSAIGGPDRIYRPGGQDVLSIDVACEEPATRIVPGDDRAPGSVFNNRGGALVT